MTVAWVSTVSVATTPGLAMFSVCAQAEIRSAETLAKQIAEKILFMDVLPFQVVYLCGGSWLTKQTLDQDSIIENDAPLWRLRVEDGVSAQPPDVHVRAQF
jgi:hypothetical protein